MAPALRCGDFRFKLNVFWTFVVPIILNVPLYLGFTGYGRMKDGMGKVERG